MSSGLEHARGRGSERADRSVAETDRFESLGPGSKNRRGWQVPLTGASALCALRQEGERPRFCLVALFSFFSEGDDVPGRGLGLGSVFA